VLRKSLAFRRLRPAWASQQGSISIINKDWQSSSSGRVPVSREERRERKKIRTHKIGMAVGEVL
jgi:hypothetical protein